MGISIVRNASAYSGNGPKGHYRAWIGPLDVTRPTKTEARDALMDAIEAAISGDWQPEYLAFVNHTALVYRDINGWNYQFREVGQRHCTTISCGTDDRAETIRSAKRHLAQAAYVNGTGAENGLGILAGDHAAILDHLHWIGFQRAYADVRSMDVSEFMAHQLACERANDPRWLTVDELAAMEAARAGKRWSAQLVRTT